MRGANEERAGERAAGRAGGPQAGGRADGRAGRRAGWQAGDKLHLCRLSKEFIDGRSSALTTVFNGRHTPPVLTDHRFLGRRADGQTSGRTVALVHNDIGLENKYEADAR